MKRNLLTLVSLFAALAVQAGPGDTVTRSVSTAATNAAVIFPAVPTQGRVVSFDVTSDNSAGALNLHTGSGKVAVVTNVAATATVVVLRLNTFPATSNLLFQTAAGAVTNGGIASTANITNKSIALFNPVGTNLALGDTIAERWPTAYHTLVDYASSATTLALDSALGLDTNDVVVLDRGSGNLLKTATISVVATASNKLAILNTSAPTDLAQGLPFFRLRTNAPIHFVQPAISSATTVYLAISNGIGPGTNLLIESVGHRAVVNVASLAGTNITLTAAANFAVTTNDFVRILDASGTNVLPVHAGSDKLYIENSTGFGDGTNIIVGTNPVFQARIATTISNANISSVTFASAFSAPCQPVHSIYKLTNSLTIAFPAGPEDRAVIANAATGLASGDVVIISSSAAGIFQNEVFTPIANDIVTSVTLSNAVGLALSAGDSVWLQSPATAFSIGATTLRQQGEALFAVPPGSPLRARITGGTNCAINQITVRYQ